MYRITSNDVTIYDARTPVEGFKVINPTLSLKDGSSGTLTFTIPVSNKNYTVPIGMASTIKVYKYDREIWEGRIINEENNIIGDRKCTCEGEMGYLNDTTQPLKAYFETTPRTYLASLIAEHNAKASANHQFAVGDVTVVDDIKYCEYIYTEITNNTLYYINDMAEKLKGHIRVQKRNGVRYIDLLAEDFDRQSEQTINFGRNLLDFTATFDLTDLATVVIPIGASLDAAYYTDEQGKKHELEGATDYITIEDVNDGKNYLYSQEAVSLYGWIETIVSFDDIDGTKKEDLDKLKQKGQEYLQDSQFQKMVLKCTAVDLYDLGVVVDDIRLRDYVKVVSESHGMDRYFTVTEVSLDLADPSKNKYTLGKEEKLSLSSRTVSAKNEIIEKISVSESSMLHNAKKEAAEMIMACTTGNINFVKLEDGSQWKYTPLLPSQLDQAQALIISETDDVEHLTDQNSKFWVWNMNGLMFTKTGGRSAEAAITMDGKIVANFIQAGEMLADRVRGGTFVVGGSLADNDGRDGAILVKNANGAVLVRLDKNGMTLDDSVKITFGNLSGVPDYQTASQVDSRATRITNDAITTERVTAARLEGKEIVGSSLETTNGILITNNVIEFSTDICAIRNNYNKSGWSNSDYILVNDVRSVEMEAGTRYMYRTRLLSGLIEFGEEQIGMNSTAWYMKINPPPNSWGYSNGLLFENTSLIYFEDNNGTGQPVHGIDGEHTYGIGIENGNWVAYCDGNRIGPLPHSDNVLNFTIVVGETLYLDIGASDGQHFGATIWTSDERLKENIEDTSVESALDVVDQIEHREFDFINGGHIKLGYVAQELEQLDSKLVIDVPQEDGDVLKQINEPMLMPYLSKSIQELHEIINTQQQQIDTLKEEINKMKEVTK